jgi:hypothetical protein
MIPWALYAQDQWTMRNITINAGVRYDRFTSSYPDLHVPATEFLPTARDYPGAGVLNWTDLDPRIGISWDPFKDGKTAIKASWNRYIQQEGKTNTQTSIPVFAATNSVARTWTDRNSDFIVQGNPLDPTANGELGQSPTNNFGKPISTLHADPDWAKGYGVRPYNWETAVSVQRQLLSGLSANVGYFHRTFGNFVVTDNLLVGPSDYDPYCITAPVDSRLPNGGGYPICGLYDIKPSKVGLIDQVRTKSSNYGDQYKRWNGVDVTFNARLPRGLIAQGGVSTGKTVTDNCDVVAKLDNPSTYNCHQESPFLTQTKFLISYPVPRWGLQLSGTFQRQTPDPTNTFRASSVGTIGLPANYVATNAVIAPSLGRNLSGGAANATINLIDVNPGLFFDALNQIDARVAKTFVIGRLKVQGLFDAYNLTNGNTVMQLNGNYGTSGASWLTPLAALPGRLFRLGLQVNF